MGFIDRWLASWWALQTFDAVLTVIAFVVVVPVVCCVWLAWRDIRKRGNEKLLDWYGGSGRAKEFYTWSRGGDVPYEDRLKFEKLLRRKLVGKDGRLLRLGDRD